MEEETPYLLERLKRLVECTRSYNRYIEIEKREQGHTISIPKLNAVRTLLKF